MVTSEIDNLQAIGQVTVGGQEWSARSCEDRVRIPVGSVVNVVSISGVKLIVRMDTQMEKIAPTQPVVPEPMSVSQMEELETRQGE